MQELEAEWGKKIGKKRFADFLGVLQELAGPLR